MAYTPKAIIDAKYASNALTTEYTATNVTTVIQQFTATNISAAAVTVTVHIVPSGGTADATNQIVKARSLAANETYTCPELAHTLDSGDFIAVVASAANSIVIRASGLEITS